MSSSSTKNIDVEPRWKTYLKGAVFLLPALILWEAVSLKCVPILVNIWRNSGHYRENAESFWNFSIFFVHYGFSILAAIIVVFGLFELFSRSWTQNRQRVVGGVVWLLNFVVICGLASLFTLTLIVFPSLRK